MTLLKKEIKSKYGTVQEHDRTHLDKDRQRIRTFENIDGKVICFDPSVATYEYFYQETGIDLRPVITKDKDIKYSDIKRWGHIMGSFKYYVTMQIAEARRDNAPANAIYKSGPKWITTDDITVGSVRRELDTLSHII